MEAHFQFELIATHIAGVHNGLADDLSIGIPLFSPRLHG